MTAPNAPRPTLVVHAGAWDIPEAERDPHLEACRRAADAGWEVLGWGGAALDAVTAAIRTLEEDPAVNAGRGSVLCRRGWVEMDAALMDGRTLAVGAAAVVRDVRHPILLARALLLHGEHSFLMGRGASEFAREQGVPTCDPDELVIPRERERLAEWLARERPPGPWLDVPRGDQPADTVGAVACDQQGHFAAGASTGGMVGKRSGRVGDSPIPGCGYFADDRLGAAACTGWGERILRIGLARRAVALCGEHGAEPAARLGIRELEERVGGNGGLILLAADGSVGHAFNTESMAWAWRTEGMSAPRLGGVRGR